MKPNSIQRGRAASLLQIRILGLIDAGIGNQNIVAEYKSRYDFSANESTILGTIYVMRQRDWLVSFRESGSRSTHQLTPQGALVLIDAKWKLSRAIGIPAKRPVKAPKNWFSS